MNSLKNLTIFLFCITMIPQCLISQTGNKNHNILLISIDDCRPKINSYGESKMITPNIDKLASEGLQLNNAFTNIAVCGASRASIMTGIRPSQERFNDYTSRASVDTPDAITLNQLFMENGYETVSYGTIYHFPDDTKEYWSENDGGAHKADYQDPVAQERKRKGEKDTQGPKSTAREATEVDE